MFGLIYWLSAAAFTALWGVTGGEWCGFGVCALLGVRVAMLTFCVASAFSPKVLKQQRALFRKPSTRLRIAECGFDLLALSAFGWLAQNGTRHGIVAVWLYLAGALLWEMHLHILEPKR